jgi:hypothetical protein
MLQIELDGKEIANLIKKVPGVSVRFRGLLFYLEINSVYSLTPSIKADSPESI